MTHLAALERKHSDLDHKIATLQSMPGSDPLRLREMKQHKLRLKDQIEVHRRKDMPQAKQAGA